MDQRVKKRWVAALRSGEYEQGKTVLKKVDRDGNALYCCLGVLCEVMGLEEKPYDREDLPMGTRTFVHGAQGHSQILPASAAERVGLDANPAVYTLHHPDVDREHATLAELNDTYGYDFNRIADVIEAQL